MMFWLGFEDDVAESMSSSGLERCGTSGHEDSHELLSSRNTHSPGGEIVTYAETVSRWCHICSNKPIMTSFHIVIVFAKRITQYYNTQCIGMSLWYFSLQYENESFLGIRWGYIGKKLQRPHWSDAAGKVRNTDYYTYSRSNKHQMHTWQLFLCVLLVVLYIGEAEEGIFWPTTRRVGVGWWLVQAPWTWVSL